MRCMILAAGYATRLYPLTENFPKPLLDINGKTILDWLLQDVDANAEIEEYVVVTNHRFAGHFEEWKKKSPLKAPVYILDDGSTENDNRLGAVRDIAFAIEQMKIDDDLLVLAGDNVLDFTLGGFVSYFKEKNHTCVMRYFETSESKLCKTGVASIDPVTERIMEMEEKPQNPKTNWAIPPFYIYHRSDLPLIAKGIAEQCGTDAPGSFIAWLCGKCEVYAYEMPGKRYDIGNLDSYHEAQKKYFGLRK